MLAGSLIEKNRALRGFLGVMRIRKSFSRFRVSKPVAAIVSTLVAIVCLQGCSRKPNSPAPDG
ncbi:MAG TPA: hypothetical protein VJQ54_06645, partial [Candidatus Sulfotelmatobacter sp.]|nr:hypothetical protein [Candidatus Sulfotelmatobacter sp.]